MKKLDAIKEEANNEVFSSMEIHRGFTYEYCQLKKTSTFQTMFQKIKEEYRNNPHLRLLVTRQIALLTFGSPRTGNFAFAHWLDERPLSINIRVESDADSIVALPAQNTGAFWHRGQLILCCANGEAILQRREVETFGEENGIFREVGNAVSRLIRIADHVDPAILRVVTSLCCGLMDMIVGLSSGIHTLMRHNYYWRLFPRIQIDPL